MSLAPRSSWSAVADANAILIGDGGDFVVRGDGRRDLALRVTATQIRVS